MCVHCFTYTVHERKCMKKGKRNKIKYKVILVNIYLLLVGNKFVKFLQVKAKEEIQLLQITFVMTQHTKK